MWQQKLKPAKENYQDKLMEQKDNNRKTDINNKTVDTGTGPHSEKYLFFFGYYEHYMLIGRILELLKNQGL